MIPSFAALVALSGSVAMAKSTTVIDLMLPAVDPQELVGSIVSASPSITTYAVQCADGVDAVDCGLPHANTVAQGPSTWSMHYSHSDAEYGSYEQDMECDIDHKRDRIECSVRMVETYDGTTRTLTTFAATEGLAGVFIPVTITAGLDKLEAAPGATATDDLVSAVQTDDVEDVPTTIVTRPSPAATVTDSVEPTETPETTEAAESESVEESSSAEPSSTSLRTTTSQPTRAPTLTPTPTTLPENAAFPRATKNAFLLSVAAVVGGFMVLL